MPGHWGWLVIFEWDEEKRRKNLQKHGVDFFEANLLEWRKAAWLGSDFAEGEWRDSNHCNRGTGVYFMVATDRRSAIRLISMRKANKREIRIWYEKQ